ncbi:GspH/FimT family pseudopilin [Pseudomonas sp. TMP25]|uniref:GspH/FimT family pseudopilin n=1 Tax=Pseudomonas sp. TMP25 TaxID=3136561 RepID=UPI0031015ADD
MKNMHGQTLVELIVSLLVLGTLLTSALTTFSSLLRNHQQTQAVNQLIGALHYARAVAALERTTVTLCSGKEQCDPTKIWKDQLLAFSDPNVNGQLDGSEKLLQNFNLQPGYSWQWSNFRNRPYIQLEADGTTRALNGTFTLCHQGNATKQVVINLTGRARAQTALTNASCK